MAGRRRRGKQAVLLIHGIGEQKPMETLPDFVEAVWTTDEWVKHPHATPGLWSKPDTVSGSFELRRLSTSKNRSGVRTDFFEYYWAHLMEGNTFEHVSSWVAMLLARAPWKVPAHLRGAWLLLLLLAVTCVAVATVPVLAQFFFPDALPSWATPWLSAGGFFLSALVAGKTTRQVIGDAARYLYPTPTNVQRRQEIREEGIRLLQKLHEVGYDRIVLVGHSLGSVIGYDILTNAWALHHKKSKGPNPQLDAIEELVRQETSDTEAYRDQQRALFDEHSDNGGTWRVTDFVTLGSPLSHAELLLAADGDTLRKKQTRREFPTCPPALEGEVFSFPPDSDQRWLHHAAPFALTRWTNLYFPSRGLLLGDFVGGPLRRLFGSGIVDVPVRRSPGLLSHTHYWTPGAGDHIQALRKAVNLLDEPPAGS